MDLGRLVGLGGVLLAAMAAQINDQVATVALPDVAAGLGVSYDVARWFRTVFVVGQVIGMCAAPQLGVIFTFRRFALFAIFLSCVTSLATPFASQAVVILALRALQGLAAGLTIPLLMTVALQVLTPDIRLYGLAVYALTATFTPNLAATLAALWTDVVGDWRFIFWEALPICSAAGVMVWYGMEQVPYQWDRLKKFDWPGLLLVAAGFGSLVVVLEQGDWFDWFASPVASTLLLISAVGVPLFIARELSAEIPLIGLQLLGRRNFLYAAITLVVFLVVSLGASQVPLMFLEQVRGFRPLQAQSLTLLIATSQLVLLPATALLLDQPWLDSRWLSAAGFVMIAGACLWGVVASSAWSTGEFLAQEAAQSVGFSFVVMPLLMMATNAVKPPEGPYASALVNTPRAIAEAFGVFVLNLMTRWRGALHRTRIVENLGQSRLDLARLAQLPGAGAPPVRGPGTPGASPTGAAAAALDRAVNLQTATLTTIDDFLLLGGLALCLLLLVALLPQRTYPPRIALAEA